MTPTTFSLEIKQGNIRSTQIIVGRLLKTTFKYDETKAKEIGARIAKNAFEIDNNFTSELVIELTKKELGISVNEAKPKAKDEEKKNVFVLTPEQLAIAGDETLKKNVRIEKLLIMTGATVRGESPRGVIKAIADAVGPTITSQRVQNVRKNKFGNKKIASTETAA